MSNMETDFVYQLWYYPGEKRFTDCGGYVVHDIFSIITPNVLYLFRLHKEYMLAYSIDGFPVELFYPEPDED